ncbi:MAG TPA: IS21-like element helper ATPase IstB [Gemmataceae bacterium]|jgi:DNA replication protein DnaC|nr:IS21-like element helper ATPase IstB [Gemmataceae bacterium]
MPRRQKPQPPTTRPTNAPPPTNPLPLTTTADLHERILADFATLKVPLRAEQLDAILARAGRDGLSHQQFLHLLIAEQANQRRERSIAHRIREARFAERKPLSEFDWEFNRSAIDRTQIEELATAGFIGRRQNLIMVGQSGVGKSFLLQAIGEAACVFGYSVRYTTSADMLEDLTAAIADRTLPKRVRYYANFDYLIIDEFGFDYIEREQSPQAANLFFKVIQARNRRCSTALATNMDFKTWTKKLGEEDLVGAFLDRIVDGAVILKINGKSYRAHRAQSIKPTPDINH